MSENTSETETDSTIEMGSETLHKVSGELPFAQIPGDTLRVAVDVLVGVMVGTPMPEHTRRFFITSSAWNAPDANKAELLSDLAGRATGWATLWMMSPDAVNWVKLEYVWL